MILLKLLTWPLSFTSDGWNGKGVTVISCLTIDLICDDVYDLVDIGPPNFEFPQQIYIFQDNIPLETVRGTISNFALSSGNISTEFPSTFSSVLRIFFFVESRRFVTPPDSMNDDSFVTKEVTCTTVLLGKISALIYTKRSL